MILPINGMNFCQQKNIQKPVQNTYHTKPLKNDSVSFGNLAGKTASNVASRVSSEIPEDFQSQVEEHMETITALQQIFNRISVNNENSFKTSVQNLTDFLKENISLLKKSSRSKTAFPNKREIEISTDEDSIFVNLFVPKTTPGYDVNSIALSKSINLTFDKGTNVAAITAKQKPLDENSEWFSKIIRF